MLMDVGILLGEMVLVRRSDYHRTLDLGRQNAAEMVSWQRPSCRGQLTAAFR
jgi:hypothetical protein